MNWLNGSNGAEQWSGTMEVRNVANQAVVTAFPIRETDQGLEARRLLRRGLERRQAAGPQLRRREQ